MEKYIFDELKRVLFHEVGHYIAYNISNRDKIGFETKEIKIHRCNPHSSRFCGQFTPKVPVAYNIVNFGIDRLPYALTNSIYGCIFQTAFFNQHMDLIECLKSFGVEDILFFNYHIQRLGKKDTKEQIFILYNNIITLLKENNLNDLNDLFDEGIFIEVETDVFIINLELLEKRTKKIISNHISHYEALIEEIILLFKD